MSAKTVKIAGAPISWGVCEVPGWGHQMTPDRVLTEMAELGLGATEFGPLGFLPVEPADRAAALAKTKKLMSLAPGISMSTGVIGAKTKKTNRIRINLAHFRTPKVKCVIWRFSTIFSA